MSDYDYTGDYDDDYCDCSRCQQFDAFDRETEADEITLLGTGLLAVVTGGDLHEWIAVNAAGYRLTYETHEV